MLFIWFVYHTAIKHLMTISWSGKPKVPPAGVAAQRAQARAVHRPSRDPALAGQFAGRSAELLFITTR